MPASAAKFDVFLYVVHLLGSGHLRRTAAIGNQLASDGHSVCLVSGGMPLANLRLHQSIRFIQLPPVRARDGNFSDLVDEADEPIDDQWWQARCQQLMTCWSDNRASVVIVESYPFARRQMRRELIPFLENASRHAIVASSIRDILQPKSKPGRIAETVELVNRLFSAVLVHGDPQLVALEETFSSVAELRVPVVYTGFVDDAMTQSGNVTEPVDIVVAAGGGAVGLALYRVTLDTAARTPQKRWMVLVGHTIGDDAFQQLVDAATDNLLVMRNRPDYRQLLARATCSVSQAGYNTAVDLLRTGCKAVLVPYSADGEVEQTIRARKLAECGIAFVLPEDALNADHLLAAIDAAAGLPEHSIAIDLSGAERVSQWVSDQLDT